MRDLPLEKFTSHVAKIGTVEIYVYDGYEIIMRTRNNEYGILGFILESFTSVSCFVTKITMPPKKYKKRLWKGAAYFDQFYTMVYIGVFLPLNLCLK